MEEEIVPHQVIVIMIENTAFTAMHLTSSLETPYMHPLSAGRIAEDMKHFLHNCDVKDLESDAFLV